ncbi:hypothetical protein SAMN05444149_105423 [Pseudosulfitobacter pseudonitzschiae]|nr:DUF6151 family protein [Pseudosulfitobacter pseudonitzschiae]QKS08562.1 hypothetical protein HT745_08780 [Pseudosulfitobacter pseudonitzschiae]SHF78496.1 hypothetical protein SAMN05444149_105423 [Pseudosulfitobacter pseudonitzschiae]
MTEITCTCGAVALSLSGPPILVAECHCTSCRTAADRLGVAITEPNGGTRFVVQRKDRAVLQRGLEHLAAFRLTPQSGTQRIVATCCNSPIWLQFKGGHWLSLYAAQWPDGAAPGPDLRTMTRDAPDKLPDDLPNAATQSTGFMARLLWAWICMGFRNPPVADVRRVLDV